MVVRAFISRSSILALTPPIRRSISSREGSRLHDEVFEVSLRIRDCFSLQI